MSHRERVILEVAVVLFIGLGAFVILEVARSNDRIAAAESKAATEQELRQKAQAEIDKVLEDSKSQIDALRSDLAKIKTPQQAAAAIPSYFRDIQPQVITVPIPAQSATATTPAQPAGIQQVYALTPEQIMSLAKQGEACKECSVNLQSEKSINDSLRNQLKACDAQTLVWQQAAKGGSLWHRLSHDLKLTSTAIMIGVVVGAVAAKTISPWRSHAFHLRTVGRMGDDGSSSHHSVHRPGQDQEQVAADN